MPIDRVYLIHHSHTDIGYTHDQPIVWELERRFLDAALDLCAEGDDAADDAFRWTVETTAPLLHWLERADSAQVERLRRAERAGRLEVTGMLANLTPLFDTDQLIESLQPLALLRERYGLHVRHAMNCDVNGHNWPLVEVLLDAGIEAFSMAINEVFGGAPLDRPDVFQWEGPSGRRLLTFNGWHYMQGNFMGIPDDPERFRTAWAEIEGRLEAKGWPLPCIAIQITHPSGDNGSADPRLPAFVRRWNAEGNGPRLRLAIPRDWWAAVRASGAALPTHRGDWTDYWNFGAISSAREQTMNRQSRARLRNADAFAAADGTGTARAPLRAEAWRALHLWDEHTWGADLSVRDPENEDAAAQWHHKAHAAYQARSLSLLLQRDAVADLVRRIPHGPEDALVLFNPSPWERRMGGPVPERCLHRHGLPGDPSASRHAVDRTSGAPAKWLPAVPVPALGWTVVPVAALRDVGQPAPSEAAVVETDRLRITFDRERGGIAGWWDKTLERELVDPAAPWPLASFVHEEVADRQHPWPRHLLYAGGWRGDWRARRRGAAVRQHRVLRTPGGWRVEQHLDAAGVDDARIVFTLEEGSGDLEVSAAWTMRPITHPEATYLFFPFALIGATARFDAGGVAVRVEADQIPGCCRDYFTVQRWVDLSGPAGGVTVATPDNPLAQFGGFHFAHGTRRADPARPWFLGWVTNNYWETNFRAHQAGRVQARYVVRPHAGDFAEAAAHRFGEEVAHGPVWAPAWDPAGPDAPLPPTGGLLSVGGEGILLLHLLPDGEGALARLFHAGDAPRPVRLEAGARPVAAAWECDLFGAPRVPLPVAGGAVALELAPRRLATVRLRWG